jgi:hypothetical protein
LEHLDFARAQGIFLVRERSSGCGQFQGPWRTHSLG